MDLQLVVQRVGRHPYIHYNFSTNILQSFVQPLHLFLISILKYIHTIDCFWIKCHMILRIYKNSTHFNLVVQLPHIRYHLQIYTTILIVGNQVVQLSCIYMLSMLWAAWKTNCIFTNYCIILLLKTSIETYNCRSNSGLYQYHYGALIANIYERSSY